ncbi:MAG: glycosyltransferase family 4 protein [Planctomycetota bacterium]|nr:glycosyltransferase family 4 protein [Planctomycetota bacterium]
MRLVLVSRRYPPQIGGAERVMANMADALAKAGHLVTVVSSQNSAEGISTTPDTGPAEEEHNPKLIRLPYRGLRTIGTAQYMLGLNRWLVRHRPDLVYVSMLKHDAYAAIGVGQKMGIPVVLRPEGAGHTGDLAWQKRDRFGAVIGRKTKKANAFVALSETIRNELLAGGYNSSMIKGLDTLLDAWPEVLFLNKDARLRIIGDGPLQQTLQEQAQRLGISGSVDFSGALANAAEELGQADLFVLPSREEGLSIALLEAMALGLPVVVSDIPGNRILVRQDQTGRLALPNDPSMLAQMIKEALSGNEQTLAMARAGRELVEDRFSIEAVAEQHLELFRDLLSEMSFRNGGSRMDWNYWLGRCLTRR